MATERLEGHLGRAVEVDVCGGCQVFWFDQRESLQLTPRATLQLFRVIGEKPGTERPALATITKCPACASQLVPTRDMQRNVAFSYRRCPHGHGRLTTFLDFLREKHFIRPLSAAQVDELRRNVQSVNCSNCGAPVDLAHHSACAHCGSPLSMLDMRQAESLIAQLKEADAGRRDIDPALPMRLEQARREVDAAFDQIQRQYQIGGHHDLVSAGLSLLARWLKR